MSVERADALACAQVPAPDAQLSAEEATAQAQQLVQHVVPAVQGFFRAISLRSAINANSLQDTLRLLTLWFEYGGEPRVQKALKQVRERAAAAAVKGRADSICVCRATQGFEMLSIDTWLQVIPQIIARLHNTHPAVGQMIQDLLAQVGREHPQVSATARLAAA